MHVGAGLFERLEQGIGCLRLKHRKRNVRLGKDEEGRSGFEGCELGEWKNLGAEDIDLDVALAFVAWPEHTHVGMRPQLDSFDDVGIARSDDVRGQCEGRSLFTHAARPVEKVC